jgi:hypothetical protein
MVADSVFKCRMKPVLRQAEQKRVRMFEDQFSDGPVVHRYRVDIQDDHPAVFFAKQRKQILPCKHGNGSVVMFFQKGAKVPASFFFRINHH